MKRVSYLKSYIMHVESGVEGSKLSMRMASWKQVFPTKMVSSKENQKCITPAGCCIPLPIIKMALLREKKSTT